MATQRLETQITVRAVDRFSSELRSMGNVTGRVADTVRRDMRSLQNVRGPLQMINDFQRAQATLRESSAALGRQRDRVRELLQAIRNTAAPTAAMRREFDQARRASSRLEDANNRNRRALSNLRSSLTEAGIDTSQLASEQRRLQTAMERGTGAMQGQVRQLERIGRLQAELRDSRARMDRSLATAANLSFVGSAATMTGERILRGLSRPLAVAIEFESAMADIAKVVDFDTPDGLATMSADIMDLSTEIPVVATGLAEIVAAGAQSGIATSELALFAGQAAQIGVAFEISAGQSGEAVASIKTQLGIGLDETVRIFDAINHLSNSMASTAPDVLNFMTRVASDGANFGFDPAQTLAVGSAMIAAGAQADVAATSFRRMGLTLTRGEAMTTAQKAALEALGLEATQVARDMQTDAEGTMLQVFERIGQLPDHVRASTMSQLFGDEARAITPLITNLDLLREALDLVEDEQDYAGSAQEEYAARAATTANQLILLDNQMARMGNTVGEVLLPPLLELVEMASGWIERANDWAKAHPRLTKGIMATGLAVGGLAVVGGLLISAAAGLVGTLAVLRFGMTGFGLRAAFSARSLASVSRGFGALRRIGRIALSTLISPLRWTANLIPRIAWAARAGSLSWGTLIRPIVWGARAGLRFIPVIGWAVLAGELSWNFLITPLGWDEYFPEIDWENLIGAFSWEGILPEVNWGQFVTALDLGRMIDFPGWRFIFAPLSWALFVPRLAWSTFMDVFEWNGYMPSLNWANFTSPIDFSNLITFPEPPAWLMWLIGQEDQPEFEPLDLSSGPASGLNSDAVRRVEQYQGPQALDAFASLGPQRDALAGMVAHLAALNAELEAMGAAPETGVDFNGPQRERLEGQIAGRERDIANLQASISQTEVEADALLAALQEIADGQFEVTIDASSVDAVLDRVRRLNAGLQLPGVDVAPSISGPGPIQERAVGGSYGPGALLVGERGPELRFESRGGFIATNAQLQRMSGVIDSMRRRTAAIIAAGGVAASGGVANAQGVQPARGAQAANVTVNMNVRVDAPSGVSDPERLLALLEQRFAQQVGATFAASYGD